jgi:hypothetical protein
MRLLKHLLVATVAFPLLQGAQRAEPAYQAANTRISTDYRAEKRACTPLAAHARDVCFEQARARKKATRAELEYSHDGNARDRHKVLQARAEAAHAVAVQICGDMTGRLKDACMRQSQAVESRALADAGRAMPVTAPRLEGVRVQRALVELHKPAAAPFKALAF